VINNYLKLTVRARHRLDDAASVRRPENEVTIEPSTGEFSTDWIFGFNDRSIGEAKQALRFAQLKRDELGRGGTISSFAPTRLRGVKVIGEPVCELTAMALAHESAVFS
jgi:hypothetical protein